MDYHKRKQTFARRMIPMVLAAFAVGFICQLSTFNALQTASSSEANVDNRTSNHLINKKKADYDESYKLLVKSEKKESLWHQPKLFNLNFKWIQNNESICRSQDNDPGDIRLMPVLVHTARNHFEERLAIRKCWGSVPIYKKWSLRFVFLLGEPTNQDSKPESQSHIEKENQELAEEHAKFGDVIIGSFADTYKNLTFKHLMGYKWILNFCKNASMVLKVDDDVHIDIVKWLDWLTADLKASAEGKQAASSVPDIYCKIWAKAQPFREKNSKWYVSYKEFPKKFYPPFCSGWAYTIPVDLIEKLYSVSNSIKFNWIDDVFITGQLVQLVKDKYNYPLKVKDLTQEVTANPKDYKGMCDEKGKVDKRKFKAIVKVERGEFFERDMMCMWNRTLVDNPINAYGENS